MANRQPEQNSAKKNMAQKNTNTDIGTETITETHTELQEPSFYNVVLLNDDYTPMDFVIEVLIQIFHTSQREAHRITMEVHYNSRGIAGTYPKEIAQEKMQHVQLTANDNEFPLNCIIEPV